LISFHQVNFYDTLQLLWISLTRCFNFSGALGLVALAIFGILGDNETFMPDSEEIYLSWSFAMGFVGIFFMFVSGILFMVEARIMARKEIAREIKFPMEKRV
jgi:hypothetical protein